MKLIAINSSPRKDGNSDVICQRLLQGAAEAGLETEKIDLRSMDLRPCTACYACRQTGKCIQKDGMNELMEKLIGADVIALSSPVYFYSICAQLKIFIDRCLPRYRELAGKSFVFIVTAAAPGHSAADETIASMRGFLRCIPESVELATIFGTGTWDKGDVYKHPSYDEAYELGKRLPEVMR